MTPPLALNGASQFTLSILPDADYLTNVVYPHGPISGLGIDQAAVNITIPPGTTPPALGALSDLAAGSVTISSGTLNWGQQFQAQAAGRESRYGGPGAVPRPVPARRRERRHDPCHLPGRHDRSGPGAWHQPASDPGPDLADPPALVDRPQQRRLRASRRRPRPREHAQRTIQEQQHLDLFDVHPEGPGHGRNEPRAEPADSQSRCRSPRPPPTTKSTTAKANPAGTKLHRKAPPPNHSFMHNLTVFPKRFNDFLKKYI